MKKAELLRALHHAEAPLVLPNIWDAGSAVLAADAGFPAMATASAGVAWAHGRPDGEKIDRGEMLEAVARIATRVRLPLTADMEAGYGTTPADVAETVAKTVEAGAVGINLEDGISYATGTVFEMSAAIERIAAARAAAKAAGIHLVINARTDVYFGQQRSITEKFEEAVARANAYLSAGADCAFVIAVSDTAAIAELVREIHGPVNIIAGSPALDISSLCWRRATCPSRSARSTSSSVGMFLCSNPATSGSPIPGGLASRRANRSTKSTKRGSNSLVPGLSVRCRRTKKRSIHSTTPSRKGGSGCRWKRWSRRT